MTPRRIVFVCPHPAGEALRGARAVAGLAGVQLFGICEQWPGDDGASVFAKLVRVANTHDAEQLLAAARALAEEHGPLAQLVTVQETLLEPVARAGEAMGLDGMSVGTVRRTLDKRSLKDTLAKAGIRVARDATITSAAEVHRFVAEVGLPIVLKPLRGSGGLATWCIRDAEQLAVALALLQPSADAPVLAEDYLDGRELCIDTITIGNEPRVHSICCYRTPILRALETPSVQWSCVMPREQDGYATFIQQGLAAVRALQPGNAMTHMEGFVCDDGSLGFTDATLRPAGARIAPMLAFAYGVDPYRAWARAVVDGCFDGPWERGYAVGTIFLRDQGDGRVQEVHGLDAVRQYAGELIVEARLPRLGAPKSATYTGDGYITVRHRETAAVEEALDFIASTVRIVYTGTDSLGGADDWRHRLQYSAQQLYKPAWDHDVLPAIHDEPRGDEL